MKPLILSIILLFSTSLFTTPHRSVQQPSKKSDAKVVTKGHASHTNSETIVYMCTSLSAKKYHSHSKCHAFSTCKGDVIAVTLEKAKEYGKTPCKICYGD